MRDLYSGEKSKRVSKSIYRMTTRPSRTEKTRNKERMEKKKVVGCCKGGAANISSWYSTLARNAAEIPFPCTCH